VSRIGKKPIVIPDKVTVALQGNTIKIKGPKGELEMLLPDNLEFKQENKEISFSRSSDERRIRSIHGLTRSLCANIVQGVSAGFTKVLKIEGVGYKVEARGQRLLLSLGFSHQVLIIPPDGITFEAEPKANIIRVFGIDKQVVGAVAARIRKIRPPEPYKGKGIHYEGEHVRRKAGKTAA
jgi:large subunit ribosomal protein L6